MTYFRAPGDPLWAGDLSASQEEDTVLAGRCPGCGDVFVEKGGIKICQSTWDHIW